jgi:hypothetical protein
MTTDATTQLSPWLISDLSSSGAPAPTSNSNLLSQADSVVGTAANYAQILSTVDGPICPSSRCFTRRWSWSWSGHSYCYSSGVLLATL